MTKQIDNSFSNAIEAMNHPEIESNDLGIYFGALAMTILSRITEIKNGRSKASRLQKELEHLQSVSNCLTAKINADSVATMSQQINDAYKIYKQQ